MEIYFNNKTYNLKQNVIFESFVVNEDENQQDTTKNDQKTKTFDDALKSILDSSTLSDKLNQALTGNKNNSSDNNAKNAEDIKQLDNILNALNSFKLTLK